MKNEYLLDTNIIIRFCNPLDQQHILATEAVSTLLNQGDECFLTAQVLVEFWVVATRPVEVNGLGWTTEKTSNMIQQLLNRFPLLDESPSILATWLEIVTKYEIKGKRTHDARLCAVMLTYGINHILTFNPRDFSFTSSINVIHPQDLIKRYMNQDRDI